VPLVNMVKELRRPASNQLNKGWLLDSPSVTKLRLDLEVECLLLHFVLLLDGTPVENLNDRLDLPLHLGVGDGENITNEVEEEAETSDEGKGLDSKWPSSLDQDAVWAQADLTHDRPLAVGFW